VVPNYNGETLLADHDELVSSILITTDRTLAEKVATEVE